MKPAEINNAAQATAATLQRLELLVDKIKIAASALNPATPPDATAEQLVDIITAAGQNPAEQKPSGPITLQRGMISIFARPGVIYRNTGEIRLPVPVNATERTFDISAVPEELRAQSGLGDTITVCPLPPEEGYTPERLQITPPEQDSTGPVAQYVWRNPETGLFELLDGINVIDPELPAPAAITTDGRYPNRFATLEEYLNHITGGRAIQLQRRRNYRRSKKPEDKPLARPQHCKWTTLTNWRPWAAKVGRGIIRIRFRTRRNKSAWTVITFKSGSYFQARQI